MKIFQFKHKNKEVNFQLLNSTCKWRVDTLLTKEPWTIEWIDSFSPSDVFWDVGANIGIYSLYASAVCDIETYAFEPDHGNYYALSQNIIINPSNIKAYCVGVSNKASMGTIGLSNVKIGSSGHSITSKHRQIQQGCVILSLNNILTLGAKQPDHIKIDIDGAEDLVIEGGSQVLKNVKSLLVEIDLKSKRHQAMISNICSQGFVFDQQQVDRTGPKPAPFGEYREFIFTRKI